MKLFRNHLQSLEELQLYWKKIHTNLHLAPIYIVAELGSSKDCISNGGKNDTHHEHCVYETLRQRYNYSSYFLSDQLPPRDKQIGFVFRGLQFTEQMDKLILKIINPLVLIGVGTDYYDYNFQVYIPTKVPRISSIAGLLSPFDIPTWIAFSVTMATNSFLFWIILCPEKKEWKKSLLKAISWLVLTLIEQSVNALTSKKCQDGRKGKEETRINWLMAMGIWLLFGVFLINFYKGDMYSYLTIQVQSVFQNC